MNCSNCQNPIQENEKFCGKCGGSVAYIDDLSSANVKSPLVTENKTKLELATKISIFLNHLVVFYLIYIFIKILFVLIIVASPLGWFIKALAPGGQIKGSIAQAGLTLAWLPLVASFVAVFLQNKAKKLQKEEKYRAAIILAWTVNFIGVFFLFFK